MTRRIALFLLLTAWFPHAVAGDSTAALRHAISARLLLMEDVARFKWNSKLTISDPEREGVLLERTTATAVSLGLPEDYARRVLAAQFEASRSIQSALFDRWGAAHHDVFADVPDLPAVHRPAIDRATTALLESLARARCELDRAEARAAFQATPEALADHSFAWSIATSAIFTTTPCPRRPLPTAR